MGSCAKKRKTDHEEGETKEADAKDGDAKEAESQTDNADEKKEETKEEEVEEKPVELTEEEKAMWYRTSEPCDVAPAVLSRCFANYSMPSKDEGFDEIRFVWSKEKACTDQLRE